MRLAPSPPFGFRLFFPRFSRDFIDWMKQFPGVVWGGPELQKGWLVPEELWDRISAESTRRGLAASQAYVTASSLRSSPAVLGTSLISPSGTEVPSGSRTLSLFPPQELAVEKFLARSALLVSSEPGCGKTAIALSAGRALGAQRALAIVPAGVREQWKRMSADWWPECAVQLVTGSSVGAGGGETPSLDTSTDTRDSTITVASYEALSAGAFGEGDYDYLIFDEAHYLKNYKSLRAKAARALLSRLAVPRLFLTGTPIATSPADTFNVLELLRPRGWGSFPRFRDRYLSLAANEAGYAEITGINEEHAEEFRSRLAFWSVRSTLAELAPWLPPLTVRPRYAESSASRESAVLDWVKEIRDGTESALCIVVYHKTLAASITESLRAAGMGPVYVDGTVSPDERGVRIAEALRLHTPLVATTKSIGIGRDDLHEFPHVLLAEQYPVLDVMEQLLGRFHRLSSTCPVAVDVLVCVPADEELARRLAERAEASAGILAPSGPGAAMGALRRQYSAAELLKMFEEE